MQNFVAKTIDLKSGDIKSKRAEILNYFEKTWAVDEKLYTQLKSDDVFYHRGDPLRHILLFYFGHTAVFFINKLMLAKVIETRINPDFESIFAIGVDEMSWDDLNEKHYNWPKVEEVRAYRNTAKKLIIDVIKNTKLTLPITWDHPFWIILMGIEHERIHLETSSVLIRQLALENVQAGNFGEICTLNDIAPLNEMIKVTGAEVLLGKSMDNNLYGWDNEYGSHKEFVADFKASKMLISNGEYLKFIEDKGYSNQKYWTEEGWNWCMFKKAEMPLFWRKKDDNFYLRLVAEEVSMPWNWPVEVNYLEAKAYCNWKTAKTNKTYRLMTEAEWKHLVEISQVADELEWENAPGNINLEKYASPCPVDLFKMGDFCDLIGNVWQWTETPITGYAGFKVHPLYDDFSTPTFDGKHNIIKGGSWISTGNEATQDARYAFRRHFYQHAGFRIVESETPLQIHTDEYETDMEVANSCENMWSEMAETNFTKMLARDILDSIDNKADKTVLDLNCDTGRLAFELAASFKKITAIDLTARYIRMPIQLQEKGFMRYIVKDEGDLVFYREVVLAEKGYGAESKKIQFMQDNANNLKSIYSGYDIVIAPNLLEELNCPILFLKNIHERLNDNGLLILASTYDWEFNNIKREHWPGGFKQDGEPLTSFEGIKELLANHFTLENTPYNLALFSYKSTRLLEKKWTEVSYWRKK